MLILSLTGSLAEQPEGWPAIGVWVADKVAGPLITGAVIALLGSWMLARANERYRSKRDHLAKAVDALRDQVEAILEVSSAYWSAAPSEESGAQEAEIDFRLEQIHGLMEVCGGELFQTEQASGPELFSRLVSAVVAEAYATPQRKAEAARPRQIATAAAALSREILRQRGQYFGSGRARPLPERVWSRVRSFLEWSVSHPVAKAVIFLTLGAIAGAAFILNVT